MLTETSFMSKLGRLILMFIYNDWIKICNVCT